MSLPLMIGLAFAVPMVVFAGLYSSVRGTMWFSEHPRTWGITCTMLGVFQIGVTLRERTAELRAGFLLALFIGIVFISQGVYAWFRQKPVRLE